MTSLTFLGDFPQVALALAFSFACALAMGFVFLRIVVRLVTREQYNVTDAPRRVSAVVWNADASANNGYGRDAASGPDLLPAAAPRNRFARIPKSDGTSAGRVVQLPGRSAAGTEENGSGDSGVSA